HHGAQVAAEVRPGTHVGAAGGQAAASEAGPAGVADAQALGIRGASVVNGEGVGVGHPITGGDAGHPVVLGDRQVGAGQHRVRVGAGVVGGVGIAGRTADGGRVDLWAGGGAR